MNVAYVRELVPGRKELEVHADDLRKAWAGVYGEQPQLAAYEDDFPRVFRALMNTKSEVALRGNTAANLVPFSGGDDARIRQASGYVRSGENRPGALDPRYCVAAGQLAATDAARENGGQDQLAAALVKISERTTELVRKNAPRGKRSGATGTAGRLGSYARLLGLATDPPAGGP